MTNPPNSLMSLPGYILRRAANAVLAELADRLVPVSLRISDATVLLLVADRTDLTSSEIGKILDIQRANMVPLLNRLELEGLIGRKPIDRKSQAIVLTDKGLARLNDVRAITDRFEAELLERIPGQHRDGFLAGLRALIG